MTWFNFVSPIGFCKTNSTLCLKCILISGSLLFKRQNKIRKNRLLFMFSYFLFSFSFKNIYNLIWLCFEKYEYEMWSYNLRGKWIFSEKNNRQKIVVFILVHYCITIKLYIRRKLHTISVNSSDFISISNKYTLN